MKLTWCNSTYLPEEFLWKAFHSMALVAQIMDDGKYKDIDTGAYDPVPLTLIHSDIKPLNSKWHPCSHRPVGDIKAC